MTLKEQIERLRDFNTQEKYRLQNFSWWVGTIGAYHAVLALLDSQPDTRILAQEALDKVLAYCAAPEGHDCGEYAFGYLDPDKVKAIIRTGHIERTPYRVREGGSKAWNAVHRYTDTDALRAKIEALRVHATESEHYSNDFAMGMMQAYERTLALLDARDGATAPEQEVGEK